MNEYENLENNNREMGIEEWTWIEQSIDCQTIFNDDKLDDNGSKKSRR